MSNQLSSYSQTPSLFQMIRPSLLNIVLIVVFLVFIAVVEYQFKQQYQQMRQLRQTVIRDLSRRQNRDLDRPY